MFCTMTGAARRDSDLDPHVLRVWCSEHARSGDLGVVVAAGAVVALDAFEIAAEHVAVVFVGGRYRPSSTAEASTTREPPVSRRSIARHERTGRKRVRAGDAKHEPERHQPVAVRERRAACGNYRLLGGAYTRGADCRDLDSVGTTSFFAFLTPGKVDSSGAPGSGERSSLHR